MRKHDVRKWLHAILDLLPLLVIPIFAINIINRSPEPITLEEPQYEVVNFNQLSPNKTYNNNFSSYNATYIAQQNAILVESGRGFTFFNVSYNPEHIYYLSCFYSTDNTVPSSGYLQIGGTSTFYQQGGSNYLQLRVSNLTTLNNTNIAIGMFNGSNNYYYFDNLMYIDLTQMFGVGNEPTIEQFNQWYPNTYYDYNTGQKELLNVGITTYNDTDIGSQFVYSLYHATDKYFNFNNVFNFADVQNWFITNIFSGSAPISFYIVWNVILYEFIMDLIFLIYALFMFFIDFCEHLIDKCFNQARGK